LIGGLREIRSGPAEPLLRVAAAGVIGQYAAHHLGGDPDEVTATFPVHLLKRGEPEVEFVDQRGGLEGVARHFRAEVMRGKAAEISVNQTRQFVQRTVIAIPPAMQPERDALRLTRSDHPENSIKYEIEPGPPWRLTLDV